MAAPDFSAAAALARKALDAQHLGHSARAADKYREALDAALAQRCPDCLIVARLQLDHSLSACNALDAEGVPAAVYRPRREANFALRLAAVATLQRRLAAGTLLGAACRPHELTWRLQTLRQLAETLRNPGLRIEAPQLAPLFGYETLLACSSCLVEELQFAKDEPERLVMTAEQVHACWTVFADAVESLALPRACEDTGLGSEGLFVRQLASLLMEFAVPKGEVSMRLNDAWQRVQSTPGLLERRKIKQSLAAQKGMRDDMQRAVAAAAADPGLRRCALASCGARELHPAHFKSCAACRIPAYCSKEHQTADWPSHKAACKAARKGKAAAADGAEASGA